MSTKQPTLTEFEGSPTSEFEERWGITKETFKRRLREHAKPTRPNETECEECGNRVSETNSMGTVGHDSGWGSGEEPCSKYSGGVE